jgi:hypothetical protein
MKRMTFTIACIVPLLLCSCEDDSDSGKNTTDPYVETCIGPIDIDGDGKIDIQKSCTDVPNPDYNPSSTYTYVPTYTPPSTPTPVTLDPSTGQ